MLSLLHAGWKTTKEHPWMITVLFLYQFAWGFVLYLFIQSIVMPLLHRYPDDVLSSTGVQVFLAESQFMIFKTDITHTVIWMLITLLAARMLITPLLNAGIYYSIERAEQTQIRPFIEGIKLLSRSFYLIYTVQIVLLLLPLYWVIPYVQQLLQSFFSLEALIIEFIPLVLGYLFYSAFIRLCTMYVQFGKAGNSPFINTLMLVGKNMLPILSLKFLLLLISLFLLGINLSISMLWAGFFAVILHQVYHLVKTIFKLWEICSHYQLWHSKKGVN